MQEPTRETAPRGLPLGAAAAIVGIGLLLGLAYNNLAGDRQRLPYIAEDKLAAMPGLSSVAGTPEGDAGRAGASGADDGGANSYVTDIDDPMAIPAGAAAPGSSSLPEIPDLGRPIQIELDALKQFWDADAVTVVDAREPAEYAEGHISGAINLPFDQVVSDPALLERFDAGGKPIVTYCGGGECELSLSLAHELIYAGHPKVLVYMGGYPEWKRAGHAVSRAGAEG